MKAIIFCLIYFILGPSFVPPQQLAINHVPEIKAYIEPLKVVPNTAEMMVEASAYGVEEDNGITCFGKPIVAYETLAVDPSVIPYGSKVYFHSTGETYIASDCGGYIQGHRVDKAMPSRGECFRYGRRMERVTVVYPNETKLR